MYTLQQLFCGSPRLCNEIYYWLPLKSKNVSWLFKAQKILYETFMWLISLTGRTNWFPPKHLWFYPTSISYKVNKFKLYILCPDLTLSCNFPSRRRLALFPPTTSSSFTETVLLHRIWKNHYSTQSHFSQSKQSWTISVAEEHFFACLKNRFSLVSISLSFLGYFFFFNSLSAR